MGRILLFGDPAVWHARTLSALSADDALMEGNHTIWHTDRLVEALRYLRHRDVNVLIAEAKPVNRDLAATLVPLLSMRGGSLDQIVLTDYSWDRHGKPPVGVSTVTTPEQLVLAVKDSLRHADTCATSRQDEEG